MFISQGTGKPAPCTALLAAACAAQECDDDSAGQGRRAVFLPLQQQDCRGWMTCCKARGKGCLSWSQSPAKHSPDLHQKNPLLLWCSKRESRAKRSVTRGWPTVASLQGASLPTLAAGISPPGLSLYQPCEYTFFYGMSLSVDFLKDNDGPLKVWPILFPVCS